VAALRFRVLMGASRGLLPQRYHKMPKHGCDTTIDGVGCRRRTRIRTAAIRPWMGPGLDEQNKLAQNRQIMWSGRPWRPQNRCAAAAGALLEVGRGSRQFWAVFCSSTTGPPWTVALQVQSADAHMREIIAGRDLQTMHMYIVWSSIAHKPGSDLWRDFRL
jgi:hypothetical protein